MRARRYANVWDALEDNREDTANMTMRSNAMIARRAPAGHCSASSQWPAARKNQQVLTWHAADACNACRPQGQDRHSLGGV